MKRISGGVKAGCGDGKVERYECGEMVGGREVGVVREVARRSRGEEQRRGAEGRKRG